MARRNLLLCFDAFGTLFRPKQAVAAQYGEVARQLGLGGFGDEELQTSLFGAVKRAMKAHPNYGKSSGMGAAKWWTNVIRETFTPLLPPGMPLPDRLAPMLLHRFSSAEGYALTDPRLPDLLRALKAGHPRRAYSDIIVGVITNSDDRVPSILSSLGVRVGSLRYGTSPRRESAPDTPYEIDFHCMSYDVGHEKPDRRVFEAAEEMLTGILATRHGSSADATEWNRLYVGDEYEKDVKGALGAGWAAALLAEDGQHSDSAPRHLDESNFRNVPPETIIDEQRAVSVTSISVLIEWLTGHAVGPVVIEQP